MAFFHIIIVVRFPGRQRIGNQCKRIDGKHTRQPADTPAKVIYRACYEHHSRNILAGIEDHTVYLYRRAADGRDMLRFNLVNGNTLQDRDMIILLFQCNKADRFEHHHPPSKNLSAQAKSTPAFKAARASSSRSPTISVSSDAIERAFLAS